MFFKVKLNHRLLINITITYVCLLLIYNTALADIYPGDITYSQLVQDIYHDISSDNINLTYDNNYADRTELCVKLVDQHNIATPGSATLTNANFIGETMYVSTCENALWYSNGYNTMADLAAWSGVMSGTWYNEVPLGGNPADYIFTDPATWKLPINVPTNDPINDIDSSGLPRVYIFQEVIFSGIDRVGNAKYGWNQSHFDIDYIWGWDPKNNNQNYGQVGTHVGWTFDQGSAKCIIWVTKNEAFLECIKTVNGSIKRTSAGLFGIGQWSLSPLTPRPPREIPRPRIEQFQ